MKFHFLFGKGHQTMTFSGDRGLNYGVNVTSQDEHAHFLQIRQPPTTQEKSGRWRCINNFASYFCL